MQNSNYNPTNVLQYEKQKLNKDADSVFATVTAGQTLNIDYQFTDDCLMLTSGLLIKDSAQGDYWKLQIVHPQYGVVFEPVHKWGVDFTKCEQSIPKANFPAKIFAGLIMRLVYISTGTQDVWICLNIDKDKILE